MLMQFNKIVIIRHVFILLLLILLSLVFCYQTANFAIRQTGMIETFEVTFFRAVQKILHLPFFWMNRNQIYRQRDPSYPGLLAGARALRPSFLIICSIFWGCFIYILFPSLRRVILKLLGKQRKIQSLLFQSKDESTCN